MSKDIYHGFVSGVCKFLLRLENSKVRNNRDSEVMDDALFDAFPITNFHIFRRGELVLFIGWGAAK